MNKKKKLESKRFPEDLGLRLVDMVRDPELIIKKIQLKVEKSKVVCLTCHDYVRFRFSEQFYTFKCKCGIHIFYPPRSDRCFSYGYRFIPIDKYDKGFKHGNNGKT